MKRHLILFSLIFLASEAFSQVESARIQSRCKNIYVWDFQDQEKNKNRTTNDLAEAVEEALTNIDQCFVLQRRNLANLVNQAAVEKGVNSIKEMKRELMGTLSGNGAKLVLFGVVDMSARDAYEVKLRIEDLSTSRILIAKSFRMLIADIANIDTRNKIIIQFVNELVGKTTPLTPQKSKEDQINIPKERVTGSLERFINLQSSFNDIAILVVDRQNEIDNSMISNIARLYNGSGYTTNASLIKPSFITSNYFNELYSGDSKTIERLGLASHVKYLVIGKYGSEFENGVYTKYICRAKLKVIIISCRNNSLISAFSIQAANGYDDKDNAEQGVVEKIFEDYKTNHMKL